jgi:hypothetical protein
MRDHQPPAAPTDEQVEAAVRADAAKPGSVPCDFWLQATPRQRMMALELKRQIHYGYDESTRPKLERVLRVRNLEDQNDD